MYVCVCATDSLSDKCDPALRLSPMQTSSRLSTEVEISGHHADKKLLQLRSHNVQPTNKSLDRVRESSVLLHE